MDDAELMFKFDVAVYFYCWFYCCYYKNSSRLLLFVVKVVGSKFRQPGVANNYYQLGDCDLIIQYSIATQISNQSKLHLSMYLQTLFPGVYCADRQQTKFGANTYLHMQKRLEPVTM